MLISGWEAPLGLLKAELQQLEEEGIEIPEELRRRCSELQDPEDLRSPALESIREELNHLTRRPDWPYEEPDELEVIRRLRPAGVRQLKMSLSDEKLLSCFHGAWRGRGVGCTLGKPVENRSRAWIKELLVRQNEWELDNYFRSGAPGLICPNSQRENLHGCMETDDDLRYPVLALRVLEQHGSNFTSVPGKRVAKYFLSFSVMLNIMSADFKIFSYRFSLHDSSRKNIFFFMDMVVPDR